MNTFLGWLKLDRKDNIWKTYVGDCVGLLVRNAYGLKNPDDFPLYSDLLENHGTTDKRTAEEIKDDILRRLME